MLPPPQPGPGRPLRRPPGERLLDGRDRPGGRAGRTGRSRSGASGPASGPNLVVRLRAPSRPARPRQRAEELVEALVALADAVLHAAGDERVAALEAVDEGLGDRRVRPSPRSSKRSFSSATRRGTVEGEGLHDQLVRADLVEAAVEAVLVAVAAVLRSGTSRRCGSPSGRSPSRGGGARATGEQLGVDVGPEHLLGRGASNSRMMRTSGTSGSMMISVSLVVVVMVLLLVVGAVGVGAGVVGRLGGHVARARRRGAGSAPRPRAGSARSTWS